MLKKLLYLYNDGHNPFPKLGKGGLGYHLPQYKKRGKGLKWVGDELIFVPDANTTPERAAELTFDMIVASDRNKSKYPESEDVDTQGFEFLEDEEIDEKNANEIRKHELLSHLESMGENTDKYLREIDPDKVTRNEENFSRDLFKKGIMIIKDLDSKLTNLQYSDTEKNKMINTQKQIAINNDNKLLRVSKQDYIDRLLSQGKPIGNISGKSLEEFLLTYGQSIIKSITKDKSNVLSNDDNPLNPYDNLKPFSTIDLYNNKALIECKDYAFFSKDSDKVVLQDTKLCGDHNYNLVFNSEGKIIHFLVKNPKNKKEKTDILPPVQGGRDYIVIYKLDDGLYEYNVSESIKKYIQREAKKAKIPLNEIEHQFNYKDIKTSMLGSSMYEDGRRITDSFGNPCFIIKKKYLKRIDI